MEKFYYMAYGANMNIDSMKIRCPRAEWLGGFYYPGLKLVFRGVADVVPSQNGRLPVILWRITEDCLESLDQFEGYPSLYNRMLIDGIWWCYSMNDKSRVADPSSHYFETIREGYISGGLDVQYLYDAALDAA